MKAHVCDVPGCIARTDSVPYDQRLETGDIVHVPAGVHHVLVPDLAPHEVRYDADRRTLYQGKPS